MHKFYDGLTVALGRVLTLSREDLKREDGQGATEYGLVIAFIVCRSGARRSACWALRSPTSSGASPPSWTRSL